MSGQLFTHYFLTDGIRPMITAEFDHRARPYTRAALSSLRATGPFAPTIPSKTLREAMRRGYSRPGLEHDQFRRGRDPCSSSWGTRRRIP